VIAELLLAIVAGASLAGFRSVAAALAVRIARRRADAAITQFKAENIQTIPLPLRWHAQNGALHDLVGAARAARLEIVARMRKTHSMSSSAVRTLPQLQTKIEQANVCFVQTMKTVYVLKVSDLAAGRVADAFDGAHGITRHATRQLSGVDRQVVEVLDRVGAIDVAVLALDGIPEILRHFSDTMADGAVDVISDVTHLGATAFHIPGFFVCTRAVINEMHLLMEDKVSLGDAFRDGMLPAVTVTIFVKIGMVIDTASGGATLGLGTVTCAWLGRVVGNEMLADHLRELVTEVRMRLNRMEERRQAALRAIDNAVDQLMETFNEKVDGCPDIGDEPTLASLISQLHGAYRIGFVAATERTAASTRQAIERLPARNWIDRLLGIDRSAKIAGLYHQAQRDVESRLSGIVHAFSLAAESHAEDALAFIQSQPIFNVAEMRTALNRLESVRVSVAAEYSRSLSLWAHDCEVTWKAGTNLVRTVTEREHELTRTLVERELAAIRELRARIAVIRRRLGQPVEEAA